MKRIIIIWAAFLISTSLVAKESGGVVDYVQDRARVLLSSDIEKSYLYSNNIGKIDAALDMGADINKIPERDSSFVIHRSPLHSAIVKRYPLDVVKHLLGNGANPNIASTNMNEFIYETLVNYPYKNELTKELIENHGLIVTGEMITYLIDKNITNLGQRVELLMNNADLSDQELKDLVTFSIRKLMRLSGPSVSAGPASEFRYNFYTLRILEIITKDRIDNNEFNEYLKSIDTYTCRNFYGLLTDYELTEEADFISRLELEEEAVNCKY